MNVTSSKLQPLDTNIMQERYATKSACGWKHSKRVYAKKNVQPCLEHSLHQRRKNAASKFISSVSNMLRMGPRQPLDCHKTQDGKQIKQPRRWCCSCMNPEASQLCCGTCKISMRIPFSIVLTGSKPLLKSHPNVSLTEPGQSRVRLGPLQLTSPLACVMQTVADSLEF